MFLNNLIYIELSELTKYNTVTFTYLPLNQLRFSELFHLIHTNKTLVKDT